MPFDGLDRRDAQRAACASTPPPATPGALGHVPRRPSSPGSGTRRRARKGFEQAKAILDELDADPSGRLKGVVFPLQIDTVTEELFRESFAYAEATGRPFTTHLAQTVVEVREMIRRHGITPVQWAAQHRHAAARAPPWGTASSSTSIRRSAGTRRRDLDHHGRDRRDGGALPVALRPLRRRARLFRPLPRARRQRGARHRRAPRTT